MTPRRVRESCTSRYFALTVSVKLYWMSVSHPSQAARKMLELKRVEFQLVDVLPLSQRAYLRIVGFRGGTVPALKVEGKRIQGSRHISRAADRLWPEPPLFPPDPEQRARVEDAELWGERELQPVPRRIARYGAGREAAVRRWAAAGRKLPAGDLLAQVSAPAVRHYGRTVELDGRRADEAGIRADLAALPQLLGDVDALLADGTIATDPANAATLQIMSSVVLLDAITDLHEFVNGFSCAAIARELFPDYPGPIPRFLPAPLTASLSPTGASPAAAGDQ